MRSHVVAAIEQEIRSFNGACGFFALDQESGNTIGYDEDRILEIASTFKLLPLIAAYRMADEKKLDLDQQVTVTRESQTHGSGLLRELPDELTSHHKESIAVDDYRF
ncbi:MAG: serine hydrolase [bacterium]